MQEETINKRLKELIASLELSQNQFGQQVGISSSLMSQLLKDGRNFGVDTAQKIISTFPSINPGWLLTGIGDMFNSVANENTKERGQRTKNLVPDNGYFKTANNSKQINGNCYVIPEEELARRVADLELLLDDLRISLMFFAETWWHLLAIDYDWIQLDKYIVPKKSFEAAKEENGWEVKMKDGIRIKIYETLSFDEKVHYFNELEALRTKWETDLKTFIKQVYMAVWEGKGEFNKLVSGGKEIPVSKKRKEEIKSRLEIFAEGKGMEKIHPYKDNKVEDID